MEHVYREENILAAYDILELFSELITVRLPIIESQKYVGLPSLLNSIFEMPSALFSSKILWCLKSENAFCSCRVKLARTRSVESASRRMRKSCFMPFKTLCGQCVSTYGINMGVS